MTRMRVGRMSTRRKIPVLPPLDKMSWRQAWRKHATCRGHDGVFLTKKKAATSKTLHGEGYSREDLQTV